MANSLRGGALARLSKTIALTIFLFCTLFTSAQYIADEDLFHYNCDETISIYLLQNNPGMNVYDQSINGITGASTSFDPGTGALTLFTGAIQGPKSYGTYEIVVDDNGNLMFYTIYLIDCCIKGLQPDRIIVSEPSSNLPTPGLVANQKILVLENFEIDIPTEINSSTLYFGAEARITVAQDQNLNIQQSTLTNYCPYRWDGILAQGEASEIIFSDSELSGSGRGFFLRNDVLFESYNSTYLDNEIAITFQDYSIPGPFYNNARMALTGNYFEAILVGRLEFALGSAVQNLALSLVWGCSNCNFFINIINSQGVQIGEQSRAQNIFTGQDAQAVLGLLSDFYLENNKFDNVANSIRANTCRYQVGGANASFENEFINTSVIRSIHSAQWIAHNTFINSGCEFDRPSNGIISGITGTQLNNNSFSSSTVLAYHQQQYTTTVKMIVFSNQFNEESHLSIEYIHSTSLNDGVHVYQNFFYSNSNNFPIEQASLRIIGADGIRVGPDNFFVIGLSSNQPGLQSFGRTAIYIKDTQNGQIKTNAVEDRVHCVVGQGELSNTRISCNIFLGGWGLRLLNAITDGCFGTDVNDGVLNYWLDSAMPVTIYNLDSDNNPLYKVNYFTSIGSVTYNTTTGISYTLTSNPNDGLGVYPDINSSNPPFNSVDVNLTSQVSSTTNCTINKQQWTESSVPSNDLILFPNPTNGFVTIISGCATSHLKVYNSYGQLFKILPLNDGVNEVDFSWLDVGVYFVTQNCFDGQHSTMFVRN